MRTWTSFADFSVKELVFFAEFIRASRAEREYDAYGGEYGVFPALEADDPLAGKFRNERESA